MPFARSSPFTHKDFHGERPDNWTNLLTVISKMELPRRSRLLLPNGIYAGAQPIIKKNDDIHELSIDLRKRFKSHVASNFSMRRVLAI